MHLDLDWTNATQGWIGAVLGGLVTAGGVWAAIRHERRMADRAQLDTAMGDLLTALKPMRDELEARQWKAFWKLHDDWLMRQVVVVAIASRRRKTRPLAVDILEAGRPLVMDTGLPIEEPETAIEAEAAADREWTRLEDAVRQMRGVLLSWLSRPT